MQTVKETWLMKIWIVDRRLFVVILLYLVGLIVCAFKQREEFPFLLYGMYSLKEEPKETYTTFAIKVDGREVQTTNLWDLQSEMITSPLFHAISDNENGNLSNERMQQLYVWLFRYIADMRFVEDNTIVIEKLTCLYNSDGTVWVMSREPLTSYVAN